MPKIIFNGTVGKLEGRYRKGHPNAPIALLMHPHPKFGGSMDNLIIYKLYYLFCSFGFSTLRFNFRGIGKSDGEFDHGPGELADAADALNWIQAIIQDYKNCWVAGYSFGAWIALQLLMRRPEVKGFLAISPQPKLLDFSFLNPCPSSGLIICGENDKVADKPHVENLVKMLQNQPNIKIKAEYIPGANHFYEDKVDLLMQSCANYINEMLKANGTQSKLGLLENQNNSENSNG